MLWDQSVFLAGQFAIWSLCLVLANLAVAAYAVGRGTARKADPRARAAVASGVAMVPLLATVTFSRLPMCLPPNMISWLPEDSVVCFGPVVAALCIVWFGCSVALTLCCRASPLGGLYVGWAVGDMLFGVGIGGGLTFGMRMLLKDAAAGGEIDSEWAWLWRVGIAIHVLAWAAFLIQEAILGLLCENRSAGASPRKVAPVPPATVDDAGITRITITPVKTEQPAAALSSQNKTAATVSSCLRPERVDKLDEIVAGAADVFGAWRSAMIACLALYAVFLLIGAFGFFVGQIRSPAVDYAGKKNTVFIHLFHVFISKMTVLPRQAQDKRSGISYQRSVFSQRSARRLPARAATAHPGKKTPFLRRFYTKNDHPAKTGPKHSKS